MLSPLVPGRQSQRGKRRSSSTKLPTHNYLQTSSSTLRYSPPRIDKDQTLINQDDDGRQTDAGSDNDAYFHWDEEETLLSDLLEEAYALATSLV